jgi:Ca2+-binding EF-hand superfamily protein
MRVLTGFIVASVVAAGTLASADTLSDQRVAKFRNWDANRNDVLEKGEYPGHPGNFRALDTDGNGVLSLSEFVHRGAGAPVDDGEPALTAAPFADPFTVMDVNRDSVLSRREWTGTAVNFNITDRNNDGVVSRDEFATTPQPNTPEWTFGTLDTNNDGWVTRSEWRDDRTSFDRVDSDNDGRVSWAEYRNPPSANDAQAQFDALDRNNDGVLSRAEWAGQNVAFHRADRNGDRVVTWREYSTLPAPNAEEAKFDAVDTNRDGVLEAREWPAGASVAFRIADRNDDGVVTFSEYIAPPRPQEAREERFEDIDHNNDGVLSRSEWHGDWATFNRLDRNDDGVVTWREFRQPAPAENRSTRFQELDTNRDGRISRREWPGDWESFSILDRSRDGFLSRAEYLNTTRLSDRFGYLDNDDDGNLSRSEWLGSAETFNAMDRNRDGRVSRTEFLL